MVGVLGLVYGMEEFVMKFLMLPTDFVPYGSYSNECGFCYCFDVCGMDNWCDGYCGDYDPCPGHLCGGYCTMPEKPDK